MEEDKFSKQDEEINNEYEELVYCPIRHMVINPKEVDDTDGMPSLFDVIYNILRNKIPDYRANSYFEESGCFCDIGKYTDMPGEEEIALILNSIDRKILKIYFEKYPDDLKLFEEKRSKDQFILTLDDLEQNALIQKKSTYVKNEVYNNITKIEEEIDSVWQEMDSLDKEIEELEQKRKEKEEMIKNKKLEIIKHKLKYLQEYKVIEEVVFDGYEVEILVEFLLEHANSDSVKIQEVKVQESYDEEIYKDAIFRIGDKYVSCGYTSYSHDYFYFKVSDELDIQEIEQGPLNSAFRSFYGAFSPHEYGRKCQRINGIDFYVDEEQFDKSRRSSPCISTILRGGTQFVPLDLDCLLAGSKRISLEEVLVKDNIVEHMLSEDFKESFIYREFDPAIKDMIGYDQKNSHQEYDLWEHTLRAVEGIQREGLTEEEFTKLRVAAFFHDIGKPDVASYNPKTGQQVYYGHAEHSVEVATPILENLGYSEEEIKELSFYIAHHDDFISYKSRLEPWMKNHEFIREINPDTVSEIIIQNKYDFERMGYDKDQIRYICYTLGHGGETPKFMTKAGPVKIDVDMDEVQEKIDSGEYDASFVPVERDYEMLLRLCKADAMSQSEVAMQNGKKVGSKKEKLENMNNIENSLSEAYKSVPEKVSEYSDEFIQKILEIASKRVRLRERSEKAKALLKEYENQMPKNNDSIGEE